MKSKRILVTVFIFCILLFIVFTYLGYRTNSRANNVFKSIILSYDTAGKAYTRSKNVFARATELYGEYGELKKHGKSDEEIDSINKELNILMMQGFREYNEGFINTHNGLEHVPEWERLKRAASLYNLGSYIAIITAWVVIFFPDILEINRIYIDRKTDEHTK